MTFSIVGYDPEEKEWGIAVQSKFLGVGAVVPFAKAGVGAVATQSYANNAYGPEALQLFSEGKSAEEVIEIITSRDEHKDFRQVGVIDANGKSATFTGEKCYDWAGGIAGDHFAAQGNILVDEKTVQTMADTFQTTSGSLAERLLKALDAGQAAGGDSRGQQSAALLVVKEAGGYGGYNDRLIDLRVDDHPEPIKELIRVFGLQQLYFAPPKQERIAMIQGDVKDELVESLRVNGYLEELVDEDSLHNALTRYIHTANFEARELERGKIDLDVLDFMKK
jgi:uncharacterized Ntn-hydrolase superfamily protein